MKIEDIARIIEAVVFVSGDGVDKDEFKRIYDLSDKEINKCLDILKPKYSGNSGVHLIQYKNKIQLCSNPELADSVAEILNPIRERSLTKAALETVAIIAYKQPITRAEIEQIRGVNCDYAVQLLQNNNLIEVVGRKDAVGKPLLFGTTDNFLKRFELESLDALPNHKELLDRIRVIHSEGDSLYREFDIPDEENKAGDDSQNQDGADTVASNQTTENQEETQDIADNKETDIEATNVEIVVENNSDNLQEVEQDQNIEIIKSENEGKKPKKRKNLIERVVENEPEQPEQPTNAETSSDRAELAPKLSWRDKIKAKMTENAGDYQNLQDYIENKNKKDN